MGARKDALYRLLGLVYLVTIGWIVISIASIAALLWMGIDVTFQLLLGREGPPNQTSATTRFLKRLWEWGRGQMDYVLFGKGQFPFLP